MLQNSDIIRIENRSNAIVCYIVPETNTIRRFMGKEIKETITMGELRQVTQFMGTRKLFLDNLIIHNKEAVEELFPEAEPEYYYTISDVDFLLSRGTLDQLLDALDFAPEGVINLIKEEAVKTKLNEMSKREAILEKTGFNVTNAIEIQESSKAKVEPTMRVRRAAVISEEEKAETGESETPVRRAGTPKYSVKQN